jgi:type I restriction-modification system DNA methylase subunit
MFVMSEKFVTEHRGSIKDITVYGQESNQTYKKPMDVYQESIKLNQEKAKAS